MSTLPKASRTTFCICEVIKIITAYLKKRGYDCVDNTFRGHINEWLEWYQGEVEKFHRYTVYNGTDFVGCKRKSLGMAKCIAEDWANLLLNERVSLSAGRFQGKLDDILERNQFTVQGNRLVEIAFALGTGAIVEYLTGGEVQIDYIRANMIYPLSWENGKIIECAFGSTQTVNNKKCVYLQLHRLDKGKYTIENHLFDDETGEELNLEPLNLAPLVYTGSETPLFQIIAPNIVNNVDLDCPMGISVYANAIPVLQSLDMVYDSYCNEFSLGRKRVMIPMSMARVEMGKDGVRQPVFDSRDTVFYVIPENKQEDGKPIEINMAIRAQEHELGLQTQLNLLSKKCGMGNDRYSFEKGAAKTATEVVSEKSDLFQNLKKHELTLSTALADMVKAIAFLASAPEPEVTIMFDDNIINDDNTKIDNNIKLNQAGLKSRLSCIMDVFGVEDTEAEKEIEQMAKEEQQVSGTDIDLFGAEDPEPPDDEA